MAAKAVVVFDESGLPIVNAECSFGTMILGLTNNDGYILSPFSHVSGPAYVRVLATGFMPSVQPITFDNQNQEVHLGGNPNSGPPNTIHLPALTKSFKNPSRERNPAVPTTIISCSRRWYETGV